MCLTNTPQPHQLHKTAKQTRRVGGYPRLMYRHNETHFNTTDRVNETLIRTHASKLHSEPVETGKEKFTAVLIGHVKVKECASVLK